MAVAVGEAQVTVTDKVPVGRGRALYFGVVTGGTEYPTGGATLGEEATNSSYKLPERIDYFQVQPLGMTAQFVKGSNKLKLYAETTVGTSTETPMSELKSKASMATALAAAPCMFYGLA